MTPELKAALEAAMFELKRQGGADPDLSFSELTEAGVLHVEGDVDLRGLIVAALAGHNGELLR